MRWIKWLVALCLLAAITARADSARIVKVLPYYLDKDGQHGNNEQRIDNLRGQADSTLGERADYRRCRVQLQVHLGKRIDRGQQVLCQIGQEVFRVFLMKAASQRGSSTLQII